ncbi:MAG: protease modulator HflC [Gammaproteobacteria bacterium]|nr:protease modulator HflC [Gammaproteobacteria bacterium]
MNRLPFSVLLIAGLVTLMLLSSIFFVVNERERAIKIRLGNVVETEYEPGLHMKLPLVESIRKFDRRILTLDLRPERVLTSEKKNVIVDSFVKWKIEDVESFFVSTSGDESVAESRLTQFIRNGVKDSFGSRTVRQVVSSERTELMNEISRIANEKTRGLGIRVVDVRIKKVELPEDVRESVYQRMEKERAAIAREIRSQGEEQAKKITAEADRVRAEIIAESYSQAQQTRGLGDASSARVYAEAYTVNPEFYSMYRSLDAYRKAFSNNRDVLLLNPDSEFFRYFRNSTPADQ